MKRASALLFAIAATCSPSFAQFDWFPASAREALQSSVAQKLQAIDEDGKVTPEDAAQAGRVVVEGVGTKLESLGRAKVIAMAPSYPNLELPRSGTGALDAIVAYQICSVPFDLDYADETPREHRYDMRAWSLFLSASVYVVSSYLRSGYLADGVTDEEAQALLGGDAMTSLRGRIQRSQELRRAVERRCADPLANFLQ